MRQNIAASKHLAAYTTRNRNASIAATTTVSMSSDAQTELVTEGLRNKPTLSADARRPLPRTFS